MKKKKFVLMRANPAMAGDVKMNQFLHIQREKFGAMDTFVNTCKRFELKLFLHRMPMYVFG